jgi:Ca2+-binding RTX toxin-like protein
MRIRSAFIALAMGGTALVPVIPATAAQAAVETCVNQRTGQTMVATKVGTSGADTFSRTALNPAFRIQSGDVISAKEGDDVVIVDASLANLVICLGDGNDTVRYPGFTDPNNAPGPFSIMGGPGNDSLKGSLGNDVVNGGSGADFVDAQPFNDADVCSNVESSVGCEIVNFPG